MNLTTKQIELLRVIGAGNGPDQPCDLDEILDRVRYETTKASLQFSIRALVAHGLVEKLPTEKRRGRQRRPIAVTELGRGYAGGTGPGQRVSVTPEEDEMDEIVELIE